jgi:cell wall-associated NlpC family hydrolase
MATKATSRLDIENAGPRDKTKRGDLLFSAVTAGIVLAAAIYLTSWSLKAPRPGADPGALVVPR